MTDVIGFTKVKGIKQFVFGYVFCFMKGHDNGGNICQKRSISRAKNRKYTVTNDNEGNSFIFGADLVSKNDIFPVLKEHHWSGSGNVESETKYAHLKQKFHEEQGNELKFS